MQSEFSKLIIFDVDGTLNQTERYAVAAYRKALGEYKRDEYSDEELKNRIGAPFSEDLKFFFEQDDDLSERFFQTVSEYWFEGMKKNAAPFPGTAKMLEQLKELGYKTAVCSNAFQEELECLLKTLNLKDKFDYIQALTQEGTKIHSLEMLLDKCRPVWAVMVGDRIYDLEAAKANSLPFIGCLYGYSAPGELDECKYSVSDVSEIPRIIEQIFGDSFKIYIDNALHL